MIAVTHPTGNAFVRAALGAFYKKYLLRVFFTTIAWQPENRFAHFLPATILREFERRSYPELPHSLVRSRSSKELMRHLSERLKLRSLCEGDEAPFSVDKVYQDLDRYVANQLHKLHTLDAVYSYEDGAESTFASARQRGIRCIYDLPIGYWRAAQDSAEREAEEAPDWAASFNALSDSLAKRERKDRELYLADKIVVASEFTKSSLELFPGYRDKQIFVVPYGAPTPSITSKPVSNAQKPLRVLFVGSLSQRKGLSYISEAMSLVGDKAVLTLIGRPTMPAPAKVTEMCRAHRWIASLPHNEILKEMSQHDILLFPSLFEGFGLVITEAISQGLPVISTPNTAAPEVLREGKDGFIVPVRSAEAIASKILKLANDRELLAQMSAFALQRASELSWERYQIALVEAVSA